MSEEDSFIIGESKKNLEKRKRFLILNLKTVTYKAVCKDKNICYS